jgi:hypothetical protein
MKSNKICAIWLAAAAIFCAAALANSAPPAGAQSAPPVAPQSQKIIKTQFVVERMLLQSLQVHNPANMREIHTFTYSPGLHEKMQEIFNAGGYQYGDNVVVWYRQGTSVALNIKGKPSKKK